AFARLASGTHSVTVTASDALGNVVTAPAAGFTVQVARGVPVIESPPPEAYVGASLPVTGYVPGGETTDHVALSINGAEVGEAGVQGDGTFSSVLDLSLPDGPITLTAQLKGELLDFSSVSNDIGPFAGGDRTITLQGDWDGDGKQDIAGWNSQAGAWDFRLSQGVSDNTLSFNRVRNDIAGFAGGDTGIMWLGDWDGDGRTDLAGWNGDAETWDTRLSHQLSTIDGAPYRRWQGSDPALQHAIGQQVDSDWQVGYDGDRACGSRDAMVYGPYVGLMPGAYRATFRLQTFEPPGGVWWFYDLADVDVTYDGGQHTLGSLSLKGTDIPRGWQEFQIDFTVDSAVEDVELRVWYVNGYGIPGACAESPSLMVDWVSLGGAIGFGQVSNNLGNWNSGKQNPMMFGDFDGNGTTDIAGWNPAGNEWDFRLSQGVSDGTLTFQKASNNLGAWNPGDGNAMIFGDFDGDGRGDVAGWNPPSQTWDFRVSQGVSGGSLTFHQVSNDLGNFAGGDAGQMMVADFDGDGDTDVAGWNSTLNDGQGGWDIQLSQVAQDSSLHFKGVSNYLGSFADPTSASRWVADFTGDDRAEIGQWPSGANSWDFRLNSGLVGRTPGSVRVTLDATPPTASFTSVADGSAITATGRITITGTAGDTAS
ncbi:MAG: FG-GAP repeat domain-containing protein, partial [Anaerolineae bacterium]